ncbi:MAG TPA: hypothetical protein VFI14_05430, partial [Chryseosolibacter sp.]|nr:hypothetical protein [Chryseosolibacter sp.]
WLPQRHEGTKGWAATKTRRSVVATKTRRHAGTKECCCHKGVLLPQRHEGVLLPQSQEDTKYLARWERDHLFSPDGALMAQALLSEV